MELTFKNKLIYSIIFGIYLILIELFFGGIHFLGSDINMFSYCALMFALAALLQLILLQTRDSLRGSEMLKRILFSASFSLTAALTSIALWVLMASEEGHFFIYLSAFLIASLLPVLISILMFIFEDAETKIRATVVHSDTAGEPTESSIKTFVLENENGKQILKVTTDRLICFEANDNYVVTYYLDKEGKLKKSMDRCSLKKIDDILHNSGIAFERVHKSYIVNPDYIEAVKGRAQAYKLQLRHFTEMIPVSRSYDISLLDIED